MKLEKQCCSIELAKKLKFLGVTQESLFYWVVTENANKCLVDKATLREDWVVFSYSAFTVAELGEILPSNVDQIYWKYETHWYEKCIQYKDDNFNVIAEENANTEADVRAKMLIYLIENKFISVDKINKRISDD